MLPPLFNQLLGDVILGLRLQVDTLPGRIQHVCHAPLLNQCATLGKPLVHVIDECLSKTGPKPKEYNLLNLSITSNILLPAFLWTSNEVFQLAGEVVDLF